MLAQHLVDNFWLRVKDELADRAVDEVVALCAIAAYRNKLASHDVTELIYHQEPADVADAIQRGELVSQR